MGNPSFEIGDDDGTVSGDSGYEVVKLELDDQGD